jgi:hypothetical protein
MDSQPKEQVQVSNNNKNSKKVQNIRLSKKWLYIAIDFNIK